LKPAKPGDERRWLADGRGFVSFSHFINPCGILTHRFIGDSPIRPLISSNSSSDLSGQVLAVEMQGTITPASDDILEAALLEGEAGGFQAVMLLLDTPGGGLTETQEILKMMEQSRLPVIGYVYPEGATAWSAGTLILMASDVAAMAPHTIIGSAQPVQLSPTGETEPINESKTINAIVALIEEKARAHGRNETAAGQFVTANLNLNAEQAEKWGVIEYVAPRSRSFSGRSTGSRLKTSHFTPGLRRSSSSSRPPICSF